MTNIPPAKVFPARKFISGLLILPKPGIVALSLIAGLTGIYIGAHGHPDPHIALWTMVGLGLSTAGAATLNNLIDRDIDSVMKRTSKRSLPSGAVSAGQAYTVGIILVFASIIILQVEVGTLATVLTAGAVFGYVVLYSLYLKRKTPLATHIGGIAGALPPLIGYAASKGYMDMNALLVFLVIFVWQQPHFWALALKYREDYALAGVPILPVAKGVYATKIRLFWWTLALIPVSVLPWFFGMAGGYYLVAALVMGAAYLGFTVQFLVSAKDKEMFLFFFSIVYLAVVFTAMVYDMI